MGILHVLRLAGLSGMIALPAHSADTTATAERLLVGKTNIFCVRAPCPWRGIARQDDVQGGPSGLLWSEVTLPRLDANPEDAQRITTAWSNGECLAIDGQFVGPALRVDRIVGACP